MKNILFTKMSTVINNFKICDQIPQHLKQEIKYFYVFNDNFEFSRHSPGRNILFVTFDDMVYGLGSNAWGKLGLGHKIRHIHTPQRVPELCHQNIHQFFNGYDFALAVNTDNNVIFSFDSQCKVISIEKLMNILMA